MRRRALSEHDSRVQFTSEAVMPQPPEGTEQLPFSIGLSAHLLKKPESSDTEPDKGEENEILESSDDQGILEAGEQKIPAQSGYVQTHPASEDAPNVAESEPAKEYMRKENVEENVEEIGKENGTAGGEHTGALTGETKDPGSNINTLWEDVHVHVRNTEPEPAKEAVKLHTRRPVKAETKGESVAEKKPVGAAGKPAGVRIIKRPGQR